MKLINRRILLIIFLISCLSSCTQKTNKNSRQFENLLETVALSKDSREFTLLSRNFYVFESLGKELFNQKGYFIDENTENQYLVDAMIRSNIRSIIGKYNANQLVKMDKTEIEKQILSLISTKIETNKVKAFDIRFNAILIDKLKNTAKIR